MFKTPILLLIYNRPETISRVFETIQEIRPQRLFVAADGPRLDRPADRELCGKARAAVLENIDWDCQVETLLREENKGCGHSVSEAITWFLDQCEKGIILEDDTIPNRSFFPYCESLLAKYQQDTRIMHISGLNWQDGILRGKGDYYFSRYPGIWGWATWRNRWSKYSYLMEDLDEFIKAGKISNTTSNYREQEYHLQTFQSTFEVDTWDYQWVYTLFKNSGICITPNVNLISNIGFGGSSTHTSSPGHWKANRKTGELSFPLRHPESFEVDGRADSYTALKLFLEKPTLKEKAFRMFKRVLMDWGHESE